MDDEIRVGPEADTNAATSETAETVPAARPAETTGGGVAGLVAAVTDPVVEHVVEPLHEHVVGPMAGALGTVLGAANQAWSGRDAVVGRRLRRRAKEPLASLYELYPEARLASPRELGLRFVPLEEIRGTAVAGAAQRGGDFLPLKPFRSSNWEARWQRIRLANDRLTPLPPVDLVKYDGEFWVVDGHNRVATALYADGTGLDAMVTGWSRSTARRARGRRTCCPTSLRHTRCEPRRRGCGRQSVCTIPSDTPTRTRKGTRPTRTLELRWPRLTRQPQTSPRLLGR